MTTAAPSDPRPLVIGLGTEHRRDDRCGLDVVRALHRRYGAGVRVAEASADATELLDLWTGEPEVHVVDGVRSGAAPGTVRRLAIVGDLPAPTTTTSTHGLSLAEGIALGRALGRLPGRLTLHTIEVADVSMGDGLTEAVAISVDRLISELAAVLSTPPHPVTPVEGGASRA
ncbi:MAG: hydrogenase maturation protease [Thermoplasmata archaeon]|nr:hydrogenase maturation protease [Thermoplasmata archaeon]MCI4354223.1 hydrogenase maturation protease [Thermoplasmata archaeon]